MTIQRQFLIDYYQVRTNVPRVKIVAPKSSV